MKKLLFLFIAFLTMQNLQAQTKTWMGTTSTNWNTASNWSPSGVPGSTDEVSIPNTTNDPVISSGSFTVKQITISASALLTINGGATLSVSGTTRPSVNTLGAQITVSGSLINNGTLNVSTTNPGVVGVLLSGSGAAFTNSGTATFSPSESQIKFSASNQTATNTATGIINFNGSYDGIYCFETVTNVSFVNQGSITYTGDLELLVFVEGCTLTNSGILTYNGATPSARGIYLSGATLNNNACGKISLINRDYFMQAAASTTNSGSIIAHRLNNAAPSTFTNAGVLKYNTLQSGTITQNTGSVIVNNNSTSSTIFTYQGTFSGTIGIFTNESATISAGNYDQNTNTFTPSGGLPTGSQTLYARITPTTGGCFYVVPFTYNNGCTQVATSTANMTWNGSVSSDWTNPCNWTPNGVPGAGNSAVIQTSSTYPTIAAGVNASVKQVYMTGDSRLTVETGASLTAQNNISGIYLRDNAQFINRGSTTVTNVNANNQSLSTVWLSVSTTTFDNYGTLTVNGNQNMGLYVEGTFNNKTGATLTASGYRGVYIQAGGKIINESNATINATGSNIGLVLDGQNTTSSNSGTINSSKIEIVNATTFTNQNCGVIKTTGNLDMSGNAVFNNYGYANIGTDLGHYVATTNNYGVLKYNSLVGSVNNTTNSVVVNNTTPIFTFGTSYNGNVNGIFTNEAATTSAGTYTQATNTFTPSGGLPTGSQTLYAKITPNTGGCFYVVPFTYTNAGQPDYSISTSGNNLIITDLTGTGETLDISQNNTNIRFNVAGKKFSLNNGTTTNFPADVPLSNLGSITVNTANGNDIITVGAFNSEVLPSLTINGGTGDDQVYFNGDITFITNANLDVDLQNDDANPGVDAITFAINSNVLTQGTGAITLKVSKNAVFNSGSTLGTNNGNLTIEANQQTTPTTGNFIGISMNSSTQLQVLGSGLLTVKGKGGNDASGGQLGISLNFGGVIYGGHNTVTVVGNGGASSGNSNHGILIQGSTAKITSLGGAVNVEGTGGGTGTSGTNVGVSIILSGEITSAGTGAVTVTGRGATLPTGNVNVGVSVQNSAKITSVGGNVTVNAYGGGTGTSQSSTGLFLRESGEVSAGGTGSVTITGEGSQATGFGNHGMELEGLIKSAGGDITLTGKPGSPSGFTYGFYMSKQTSAPVSSITTAVNGGNISITTNSLYIVNSPDIRTNAASSVTLKPFTAGTAIDISFAPDGTNAHLILSDSELDRISTGTLIIGDATAGDITVGIGVTRPTSTNMQLISSGDVAISGGGINTGGGTLLLDPGASTKAVKPTFNGTDVTASTLSFANGDLQITLNGTTLGDGTGSTYSQLNVVGAVNLTGLNLAFAGSYTPVGGETFTIVSNDGTDAIVGTFNGLAQGATISDFRGSGLTATISYTGGSDNNDVVITVASSQPDYSISTSGNNLIITDLTGTGETLDISQNNTNIHFNVAGKKFSLNNGTTTNFPADVALNDLASITVNTANGSDIINVGAFTGTLPSLTINGGTGNDQVNFNGDITFISNANLDVDLQNDDANPGVDAIAFAANANVSLVGTGAATLKVSKNVSFNTGSSLTTTNGNLTIEANQQAVPTTDGFYGINVGASVNVGSTGSGAVTLVGKGGATGGSNRGISIAGTVSGGMGTLTLTGQGGAGTGIENIGIRNVGTITSLGGNLSVTATGGGAGASHSNFGIYNEGTITAGNTGTVTVLGTGGQNGNNANYGVYLTTSNALITSSGGNVSVTGQGGGGTPSDNGIQFVNGNIGAGGAGSVTIRGTANGQNGYGVFFQNGTITSSGGNISLTGEGKAYEGVILSNSASITAGGTGNIVIYGAALSGTGTTNRGITVNNTSQISTSGGNIEITAVRGNPDATDLALYATLSTATNGGNITLIADDITMGSTAAVTTQTGGQVFIRPRTNNTPITLGSGSATSLSLDDDELDAVSTGTLNIGNANSGSITINGTVSRPAATAMNLTSNGAVTTVARVDLNGGNLHINANAGTNPDFSGTDLTVGTVSFTTNNDLNIAINGTTMNTGYKQLNVAGGVNLTGVDLVFSGSYTPVGGETFTIVSNDGTDAIVGTFNNLDQGATIPNFRGSGLTATISYTGGSDNNDVVITVAAPTLADINIQGNGFDITNGDTSPRTEDGTNFGDIDISLTEPVIRSFTIQNTGTADLVIPANGITKSGASDFGIGHVSLPLTIAPGGSATFPVIIDASGNGQRTATISIQSNDADESPYTFDVRAVGVSPEINITGLGQNILDGDITPSGLDDTDFGILDVASGSVSHTFTIQNVAGASGNLQLNAGAISVIGTHSSDFTVSAITLPATISAGQSTTFVVTFNPSALGLRTATVRVMNNDLGEGTYDFTVQGYGGKPFITTWKTDQETAGNTAITIPTKGTGYNYDVDWNNDGIFDQFGVTGNVTHNYDTPGTYTVAIRGLFPHIYFENDADNNLRIIAVNQWGDIDWKSFEKAFLGCGNLQINASDTPDLNDVADMSDMFKAISAINQDISGWDVSNVTNMASMFSEVYSFNQNISGWNVSNVTNMSGMFRATTFNQNIGSWDVSKVTSMQFMFFGATAFDQSLAAWGTKLKSDVNLTNMLDNCGMSVANYDATLIGFNQSTATGRSLGAVGLKYCESQLARTNLITNKGWTITGDALASTCLPDINVKGNSQTIVNGDNTPISTDHTDFGPVTVASGSVTRTFTIENPNTATGNLILGTITGGTTDFTLTQPSLTTIPAGSSTTFTVTFDPTVAGKRTTTISIPSNDPDENPYTFALEGYGGKPFITTWKTDNTGTSNSTSITIPTLGTGYNYDVDWNNDGIFDELGISGNVTHDYGTAGTYTVAIRGDFPRIHFNSVGDASKLVTISQWGDIAWTSMASAFNGCNNLTVSATDVPNLSGVSSLSAMFANCTILNGPANISTWNTSTITNMSRMFQEATSFNQNISNWDVSNVTTMWLMFQNATAFDQSLAAWGTKLKSDVNLTNMLDNCGMSVANYDATLIGFNQGTATSRSLGAAGLKYCTAVADRDNLLTTKSWTITGDAQDIACSSPDYTITTTSNTIVITDAKGASETVEISENSGKIRFNVTGKTYSIDGGLTTAFTTPAEVALASKTSIVINTAVGNDIINVGAFATPLPSLTINGGTGDDAVNFNGDITFASNANLEVDLQNDDAMPGVDAINFAVDANIVLSGMGTATLKVSKNVTVNAGSSLLTQNGNLVVEANQQATPTTGEFAGIDVDGGTLKVAGSGQATLKGKGGTTFYKSGISVSNGGRIEGGTAAMSVIGTGGIGSGNENIGVSITGTNSKITSSGGNVSVTGQGAGVSNAYNQHGVVVKNGGMITAGGTGTVTVQGTGAAQTQSDTYGVHLNGGTITSSGGNVSVTGLGGGNSTSFTRNHGIYLQNAALISAGGTGTVTANGTGGNGINGSHQGIFVIGSAITSNDGNISLTGQSGGASESSSNRGIVLEDASRIAAGGTGSVTIEGTGSSSTAGFNYGVQLGDSNCEITTNNGNIRIIGRGGQGVASPFSNATGNTGVGLSGNVIAGGTGTIYIEGTGASQSFSDGIEVGGVVNTNDGAITIVGVGGANASAQFGSLGVDIDGTITAGNGKAITIQGTAGSSTGTSNIGVYIRRNISSTTGGSITVTGIEGGSGVGIEIESLFGGQITTANAGGNIAFIANSINIKNTANISTNTSSTVTLRPYTNGVGIDLGAATDALGGSLNLSDGELDRITAGTLQIGNTNSGAITVSSAISRAAATNVNLTTAGVVNLNASALATNGGNLAINAAGGINPTAAGTDVNVGTASFTSGNDLAISINGATADTDYRQLKVEGSVNLAGLDLVLSGSHVPVLGQSFVIVNNDGSDATQGVFNGLPEGATIAPFLGSQLNARISYVGGDGNDVVLTAIASVELPSNTANVTICKNATASLSATCLVGQETWYNAAGTTQLFVGSSFVTPTLSASTGYKVRCELAPQLSGFIDVMVTVVTPPTITLSALQQTLNEGNNPVLCDTDGNPVNSLQFTVSGLCVSGSPVWRVQVGSGAWSAWSPNSPVSQSSNNQVHRYQAACDANCTSTYSGVIELTINNRATVPQNVSLVVDGVTVAVGESKEVCSLLSIPLMFNANCATGEIILYSVDGGEYSSGVPTGLVDNQFHNYRIRCRKSDGTPSCVESESGVMRLKLVTIPTAPTVSLSSTTSCDATASFSGQSSCGSLRTVWYNATTNVALPNLPSTVPSQTTSYYARCQTENGCVSEKSNVVTFTLTPTQVAPVITASQEIVCTGTIVTVSANCPAGSQTFWNTGVTTPSFEVAFSNVTKQTYWAKCLFDGGCQSSESVRKDIYWNAFVVTLINVGETKSSVKPANDKSLWSSQFIMRDGGPELEQSTQQNPTLYFVENANKIAPRYWTINVEACGLSTDGSLTFDMLATPEVGVIRSFNTHENNAPYFMYANREGWTELYAQNHPAYGFYQDNGAGGNVYDAGLPKGLYKLGIRYWDMKGWGSIYPSTRQPQGNVLAYQEYWFRIQSRDGVGVGAARTADSGEQVATSGGQGSDRRFADARDLNPSSFATVLPNPISNVLRLKVQDSKGQAVQTALTDASGREVLRRMFVPETNTHQEEFEVSELPTGMYFLKVSTSEKQTTLKVVKVN